MNKKIKILFLSALIFSLLFVNISFFYKTNVSAKAKMLTREVFGTTDTRSKQVINTSSPKIY